MDQAANVTLTTINTSKGITLIDAINLANNTPAAPGNSHVINLPANRTITFTQPLNNTTITSNNVVQDQNWYGPDALPAISSNIAIEGNGDTLAISGTNMRFFYVSGGPTLTGGALPLGTLELDHLTLEGGTAQGGNGYPGGGGGMGAGGAIFNQGNLTLNGDTLTDNQAIGGFAISGSTGGGGGMGSSANGDSAGGFGGNFNIDGGSHPGSPGTAGGGGAGFQTGDNGSSPKGIVSNGGETGVIGGAGGGLGDFGGDGGGNTGGPAGDGGGGDGGGGGGGGGTGSGGFGGGAGSGGFGGGSSLGAAGGGAGLGGAVFNMFGTATLINSTLSTNTAQGGNVGIGGFGDGGGLFNLDGSAALIYTTVANNRVSAGTGPAGPLPSVNGNADGGGIYNLAYGNTLDGQANTTILTLDNSVIGQNENYGLAHDLVNDAENGKNTNTAQINGSSSIVQGSAMQSGNGTNIVADGAITITSAPNLAPALADNGGLTETLAPLSVSPVLGAAKASLPGLPTVDQRGLPRPPSIPDDGALQTQITTTAVTNVTTTYTSAGMIVQLAANVDASGLPVTEGQVQLTLDGISQTVTMSPSNPGVVSAAITLPSTISAGSYTFEASYSDPNRLYTASSGTGALTITSANSALTVADTNTPIAYNSSSETLDLQTNVASSNGGVVNKGSVVFTVNGTSSLSIPVSDGVASTTLTLSGTSLLNPGYYPNGILVTYTDGATNNYASANGTGAIAVTGGTVTGAIPTTTIAPLALSNVYNGTTAQTVTLSASVASNNGPVSEGTIAFTVNGTNLTATANVANGTATAALTLPAGFAAGTYSFSASYADTSKALYGSSIATTNGTLTIGPATVTTTPLNIPTPIDVQHGQAVALAPDVSSVNGGTVDVGSVTFTVINPNGANLTATANVANGTATATLTLADNFPDGTYVYIASYADSNNANGVPNFAARNGVGTVDPPGSDTGTLTVTSPPAVNPPVPKLPPGNRETPPPASPVGKLTAFALGLGPTGIDLLEVDSQGDVFAQGLFGGDLQLVSTSLQLPLVLMGKDGLLAQLAADNGQEYFIEVFDPLLPSIRSAVLASVHS